MHGVAPAADLLGMLPPRLTAVSSDGCFRWTGSATHHAADRSYDQGGEPPSARPSRRLGPDKISGPLAQVARSVAASQAGANGAGGAKSLAAAISASAELRLPDELAARAQRQLKICVPQASRMAWSRPLALAMCLRSTFT